MFLALSSAAHAFELGAFGGFNFEKSDVSPSSNPLSTKSGFTIGATVGADLVPMMLSWEIGLYNVKRKTGGAVPAGKSISGSIDSSSVRESYNALEIPLVLRLKPIPFLSPGLGFFYSASGSDLTTEYNTSGGTEVSEKSPIDRDDYGLVASIQARFPLIPTLSFTIDGRYLLGLKENPYHGSNVVKLRELQVLGGVTFSL
ncbi:MAG: PorT family protein [Oligoflexia bacterium]|nr:PorT family protein [Oligoflexia bacterium]